MQKCNGLCRFARPRQKGIFIKPLFNTFCMVNKKLYRAFSRQANGLTLNIPVLQGLLRVNSKAEKGAES